MGPLCHREPDMGHPVANHTLAGSPSPGGPSPAILPVTQTWLPGGQRGDSGRSLAKAGSGEGVYTHRSHRAPRPNGAMALVVVEPQCVAVPCRGPLHLHHHLLRPRGHLHPGHCTGGGSGHLAPSTACPAQGMAPQHRAWHSGGHPLPQHPPPTAPQWTRCHGQGTPTPTLALGDSSLCRGPRAVCGDRGSAGRGGQWPPRQGTPGTHLAPAATGLASGGRAS